ncbi:anthrone oxygenase family protein [Phaeovulum sp. W22_SRMD_FR3]|uniref:anthrone oxygenase family protein n=1 Tax=Phaeovulum sp. W22_SRMD_FR3 TaxID=3240274 RepID=UPI003F9D50CC
MMRWFARFRAPALFTLLPLISVGFCGACFGFFFAWQSSTLRGLDMIDPATAIAAMQAMNASVRNPVFGTVYFGTPLVLALAVVVMAALRARLSAALLGLGLVLHMTGVFGVTAAFNVPLNRDLAAVDARAPGAGTVWQAYSARWRSANLVRMIAAGACLILVASTLTPAVQNRRRS